MLACGGDKMIKTERLMIRRVESDDWRDIQNIWLDESSSQYAQYDNIKELDDKSVSDRIAVWAKEAKANDHIFFAICLDKDIIGYISLNRSEASYEIGYCFHSNFHGKGYAKESILAVIPFLKSIGVSRVTAGTAINNIPSIRLLSSLGFKQIGTEKVSFYKDSNGNDIFFDGGVFELEL